MDIESASTATRDQNGNHHDKLGLALSGGGFRASLFHVGVLRRLAELDLLREISALSTVSGGSIVGACYILRQREELERPGRTGPLSREDYVRIAERLEDDLRCGISANLRTRLFANPIVGFGTLVAGYPLGRQMGKLYQRHLFSRVEGVGDVQRLSDTVVRAPSPTTGAPISKAAAQDFDLGAYNLTATDRIPKLLLNATTLNTGRPFVFSAAEIGDPELGYIRFDEVRRNLAFKALRERLRRDGPGAARRSAKRGRLPDPLGVSKGDWSEPDVALPADFEVLMAWWGAVEGLNAKDGHGAEVSGSVSDDPLAAALGGDGEGWPLRGALDFGLSRRLVLASPGALRPIKVEAWYLTEGKARGVWGGIDEGEHRERLWDALRELDRIRGPKLRGRVGDGAGLTALCNLVRFVYWMRSAEWTGVGAHATMASLTLGDAVAASASFPPVFPPFVLGALYDPAVVATVGLSDGGVYDNQGATSLLDDRCASLIVSDAGRLADRASAVPWGRFSLLARLVDILQQTVHEVQVGTLRVLWQKGSALTEAWVAAKGHDADAAAAIAQVQRRARLGEVAYFHMSSDHHDASPPGPPAPAPYPFAEDVSALRTDLDWFHPVEADALVYQGYQLCDRFVRAYLSRRVGERWPSGAPEPQRPLPPAGPRDREVLRIGRARLFRATQQLALGLGGGRAVRIVALALMVVLVGSGLLAAVAWGLSSVARGAWWVLDEPAGGLWGAIVGVVKGVSCHLATSSAWLRAHLDALHPAFGGMAAWWGPTVELMAGVGFVIAATVLVRRLVGGLHGRSRRAATVARRIGTGVVRAVVFSVVTAGVIVGAAVSFALSYRAAARLRTPRGR